MFIAWKEEDDVGGMLIGPAWYVSDTDCWEPINPGKWLTKDEVETLAKDQNLELQEV